MKGRETTEEKNKNIEKYENEKRNKRNKRIETKQNKTCFHSAILFKRLTQKVLLQFPTLLHETNLDYYKL